MKQNRMTLACVLSGMLAGTQIVAAVTPDNPYLTTITNRNLFNLKAPPDPASLVPQVAAPPLPVVQLAGITTLMGKTVAILRVPRVARPPEPAKEISVMLAAGAPGEEGVQVSEINIAAGTVKINNHGTPQLLDITKNAPKTTGAPAPAGGLPVPPPRPGGVIPVPPPAPAAAPAVTSIGIGRPVRGPGGASSEGVMGGGPGQMGVSSEAAQPEQVSAEVAAINYATWVMRDKAKVEAGEMPPYPPSELTEMIDQEEQQQGNQAPPGPPGF